MKVVLVPPAVTRELYRRARHIFPCEVYGILLGRETDDRVEVLAIYYPPEQKDRPSPDFVNANYSWFKPAHTLAAGLGVEILGDIHSHCYDESLEVGSDLSPSESDWHWQNQIRHDTGGRYRYMGIVRVLKKGTKLTCSTRFWPAVELPVTAPWQQPSISKPPRRNSSRSSGRRGGSAGRT